MENLEELEIGDPERNAGYFHVSLSGFPYSPLAMCKIGERSFVAGAELPKKYLASEDPRLEP